MEKARRRPSSRKCSGFGDCSGPRVDLRVRHIPTAEGGESFHAAFHEASSALPCFQLLAWPLVDIHEQQSRTRWRTAALRTTHDNLGNTARKWDRPQPRYQIDLIWTSRNQDSSGALEAGPKHLFPHQRPPRTGHCAPHPSRSSLGTACSTGGIRVHPLKTLSRSRQQSHNPS